MRYLHTNNASSNLRNAVTVGQSSIVVTSGHGTLFPNPAVDQGFFVTVEDRRSGRLEIMLCTSRVGDTLNVTRGQQGTVPQSFAIGVNVANRITAQILNEFVSATIDVVDPSRIPPITDAMMAPSGINANKTTAGVFATARIPAITSGMITSLDAAKLTGVISPNRITDVPASALPPIPSALLTSVPAEELTGTISPNRIASLSLADAKISDLNASKLTGTINEARFPTAFSINGAVSVGTLVTAGDVSIGGSITNVDSISVHVGGDVVGQLVHRDGGGYFLMGSYDTDAYGSGYGRIWYNANDQSYQFRGHTVGTADIEADSFIGSGISLTGVMKLNAGGVDTPRLLLGPGGGHTAATVYDGSVLATPNLVVNTGDNSLSMTFSSNVSGTWRAMQTGSAGSGRVFGIFVRVS